MQDRRDTGHEGARQEGCMTGGMKDMMSTGQYRCRAGGIQDRRDARQEGCMTGRMKDMMSTGQYGCRTGGVQYRRDAGHEGYRKGGM